MRTALSPAIEPPSRKRDATTRSLLGGLGLGAQLCDRSRRVLKVGVHHADPGGACRRDSCDDRAAESAVALAGLRDG